MKAISSVPSTPSRTQRQKNKHYLSISKYNTPLTNNSNTNNKRINNLDPLTKKMSGMQPPLNLFNQRTIYKNNQIQTQPKANYINKSMPIQSIQTSNKKPFTDIKINRSSMIPNSQRTNNYNQMKNYTISVIHKNSFNPKNLLNQFEQTLVNKQKQHNSPSFYQKRLSEPQTPLHQPHSRAFSVDCRSCSSAKRKTSGKFLTVVSRMPVSKKMNSLLIA